MTAVIHGIVPPTAACLLEGMSSMVSAMQAYSPAGVDHTAIVRPEVYEFGTVPRKETCTASRAAKAIDIRDALVACSAAADRYALQQLQSSWQQQGSFLQQHFGIRIARVGFIVVPPSCVPSVSSLTRAQHAPVSSGLI